MTTIITVHSFARAAGRSTIASNLSYLLAQSGKRVGALDMDFHMPSLHLLFGLPEDNIACTINTFLWKQCAIQDVAYDVTEQTGVQPPGTLLLIPASTKPDEIIRMLQDVHSLDVLNQAVNDLVESYDLDYLVIDTTPGMSEDSMLSTALSDILITILRPDMQDYQGTAVSIEVARTLQVPRLFVVMNYTPESLDTEKTRSELLECYECEVGALLPSSDMQISMSSGRLIVREYPNDPFSTALRHLARRLLQSSES